MMRNYYKLILIVMVISLLFVLPALYAEGGSARDQLVKNGIEYSEDGFVKCAGDGDIENVKLFIAEGMEINAKNKYGETPLMAAAVSSHTNIVKILLEKGAEPNTKDNDGSTALILSAMWDSPEIIKLIVAQGADVNVSNNFGKTALMLAAEYGQTENVNDLLRGNAKVNVIDNHGNTPLWFALGAEGNIQAVKLLVENGANVKTKNKDQSVPMVRAVRATPETVKYLIDKGAEINSVNNFGESVLGYAKEAGNPEIIKILKEAGATE